MPCKEHTAQPGGRVLGPVGEPSTALPHGCQLGGDQVRGLSQPVEAGGQGALPWPLDSALSRRIWSGSTPTSAPRWSSALP